MNSIRLKAYAKINLGLDVLGKRPNGYHDVRMIMQSIGLHDKLTISLQKKDEINVSTNLHYLPTNENNLVYKAAELIKNEFGINSGVFIELEKRIPVAAGLAGGSSDAAATLYGLNKLFRLNIPMNQLMEYGLQLGADVPFCLLRGTAISEGIGEVLTPLPSIPSCYILLVKPDISVSTKFVYENLDLAEHITHPDIDEIIDAINKKNLNHLIKNLGNVLETVTTKEYPIIKEIKEKMLELGALGSMMSGSGPTVFGIFTEKKIAQKALYYFKVNNYGKQVFLTEPFFKHSPYKKDER